MSLFFALKYGVYLDEQQVWSCLHWQEPWARYINTNGIVKELFWDRESENEKMLEEDYNLRLCH